MFLLAFWKLLMTFCRSLGSAGVEAQPAMVTVVFEACIVFAATWLPATTVKAAMTASATARLTIANRFRIAISFSTMFDVCRTGFYESGRFRRQRTITSLAL